MMVESRPTISNVPGAFGGRDQFVVAGDHVVPPSLLQIPFQLDPQRAVVPKPLDAAVDFAGLKKESTSLAKRHDFFHRLHWVRHAVGGVENYVMKRSKKELFTRRM